MNGRFLRLRVKIKTRKNYAAFGEELSSTQRTSGLSYDTSETRKGYTGYEKDTESSLEFAQARYYNTTHGRFTSVDPLTASATIRNPQTFNRYSYVLNSPYKFVDPLGLIACCDEEIRSAIREEFEGEWGSISEKEIAKLSKEDVDKIVEIVFPEAKKQFELRRKAQLAENATLNNGGINPADTVSTTNSQTTTTSPSEIEVSTKAGVQQTVGGEIKIDPVNKEAEVITNGETTVNSEAGTKLKTTIAPGTSSSSSVIVTKNPNSESSTTLNYDAEEYRGEATIRLRDQLDKMPLNNTMIINSQNAAEISNNFKLDSVNTLNNVFNRVDQLARDDANRVLPVRKSN